jgi:hypothetical protein
MEIEIRRVEAIRLPARRKARARRSMGGPIMQYIMQIVEENPDMKYDQVAEVVKRRYDHARTSEKSVASTVYRAGMRV